MPTYKDYIIDISPTWLQEADGQSFSRGYAQLKDAAIASAKQAVLERMPDRASPEALELLGGERQLDKGTAETEDEFRARIKDAWSQWQYAGTAYGVLLALKLAGYSNVHLLVHNGKYYTLDSGGDLSVAEAPGGVLATNPDFWNVFTLLFYSPLASWWAPSVPSEFSDEMENIRRLVKLWKPAHAIFSSIKIHESGLLWGFPSTLEWGGSGLVWGGSAITYQGE